MRITDEMADFIKTGLKEIEPDSKVYLFGSRTDDQAKGGDIDILWLTSEKISSSRIRPFRISFFKKFGWQKLDIVNFTFTDDATFKNIALETALAL